MLFLYENSSRNNYFRNLYLVRRKGFSLKNYPYMVCLSGIQILFNTGIMLRVDLTY
jgi:hypothetical protein